MGSDAEIYVFDEERYLAEVVPAAKHLLLTGEIMPWWRDLLRQEYAFYNMDPYFDETIATLSARPGLDLDRYCTYLGPDLGMHGPRRDLYAAARDVGHTYRWDERACRSTTCPMRPLCLFHQDQTAGHVEEFNHALEVAVAVRCLGEGQFVGRSQTPFRFQQVLAYLGVAGDSVIHTLLERLGRRGFVVGYGFANGDGLHGWLTPEETHTLYESLDTLPLPRYEPTIAMMRALHRDLQAPGEMEWDVLSLSFVRTVAGMAVEMGRRILWGNDVTHFRGRPT